MFNKIPAVADEDVKTLLKNLNLTQKMENKEIFCSICGELITTDNVGCIYPSDGKIQVCCEKLLCLQNAINIVTPLRLLEDEEVKTAEK